MPNTLDQIVIVGAGLTGLVTASELAERGVPSLVLEAEPRVGGRVRSITFPDGAMAEAHLEEFWESSPALDLLRRFDLPLSEHAAHSSVLMEGDLHLYDPGANQDLYLAEVFPRGERDAFWAWNTTARAVLDELQTATRTGQWSPRLASLQRTDLRAYVGQLGLPRSVAAWIQLTIESETAVEWHRVSALDGLAEMRPFLVDPGSGRCERNFSVVGGNERLIDALLGRLPDGSVQTGSSVHRVVDRGQGRGVEVHYSDASGRAHIARGHHAVLATPVWSLPRITVEPGLDRPTSAAIATTRAGSYVKVILRLRPDAEALWARHGQDLFPLLTDGPVGCLYRGSSCPVDGDHLLTLLIPGRHARALNGLDRRDIVASVLADLEQLPARQGREGRVGPLLAGISRMVTDSMVFDHPQAVAFWPHALGRSRFDAAAAALRAPHGNVLIGGDSTDSSHSDGAVRAGRRMAGGIAARLGVRELVPT